MSARDSRQKETQSSSCFVLCFLSASCRCALLAGLLAALVACLAGLLLQSALRMVQVSASSGLRDQSFMIFMLSCVAVAVAGSLLMHIPSVFPMVCGRSMSIYISANTP